MTSGNLSLSNIKGEIGLEKLRKFMIEEIK
jgi:hypothetical protein